MQKEEKDLAYLLYVIKDTDSLVVTEVEILQVWHNPVDANDVDDSEIVNASALRGCLWSWFPSALDSWYI